MEKNCRYTKFPEEDENTFGIQGKYTKLKAYYDLKRKVKNLKLSKDVRNDFEYVRRKNELTLSREHIRSLFEEIRSKVQRDKIRTKEFKDVIDNFELFEKKMTDIGEDQSLFFVNENPQILRMVGKAQRVRDEGIKEFYRKHDHFTAFAEGVDKNAKEAKVDYPRRKSQLSFIESDPQMMKLVKEISEEELDKIYEQKRLFKRSKNLNIVFEGTGQYSPELEMNMKVLQSSLGMNPTQKAVDAASKKAYELSNDKSYFASQNAVDTWSGTIKGPVAQGLYRAPDKKDTRNLRNSQWLYMPSENVNAIGSANNLFSGNQLQTRKETFSRAIQCLKKYLYKYPDTKISIMGHSSGVKAAIDFAKYMKRNGIQRKINMLGIDPVDDMVSSALIGTLNESVSEFLKIGGGSAIGCLPVVRDYLEKKVPKGVIASKYQDALTRPKNALVFHAFYQTQDQTGLGGPGVLDFGIHGSPVKGANKNKHLIFENSNLQHHGAITQQTVVIDDYRNIINN